MSIATTRFILVGGFLGAGKTTLLAQAAARLAARGYRVALLANDQAADLVDTAVLQESGAEVDEVSGGCFCCRFSDMVAAIERLKTRAQPDYIVAEPVGSCTDLSATVLQPLKQMYGRQVELGPFSVLIDVKQAKVLLRLTRQVRTGGEGFPDDVLYIYRKQVEEADVIVLNKTDLVAPADLEELRSALAAEFPDAPIVAISALSGEGVDAWLDLLSAGQPVGRKIAEVDYDTYAAGEAALGWMNASAKLTWAAGDGGRVTGDEDAMSEPGRVGPDTRREAGGGKRGPHPSPLPKGEGTSGDSPLPKGEGMAVNPLSDQEGTGGVDWSSFAEQLLQTVRAGIVRPAARSDI